ncbi:hypothetical protein AAIH28_32885, partial [Pseudomonas aeruginosa]
MNDSTPLSGLAKQLVLNELLDEKTARQAQVQAAPEFEEHPALDQDAQ